jgi:hypothetical protein
MPARITAQPVREDQEVLRLAGPVVLWWVWVAFVAANVVDFAIQGLSSARFGAVVSAVLLFVTGLAYTLALRPRVIADGAGLTVVNPFRTHRVPWRVIESVDTGEWLRVRYAAPDGTPDGTRGGGTPNGTGTRTLHCWALYVSARARRKMARGTPGARGGFGFNRASRVAESMGGYATEANSRLPEEARYLASLPVAKAMASRLDTRATKERARRSRQGQSPDQDGRAPDQAGQATATWDWPSVAAVVIPAVVLIVVALV